LAAPLLCDLEKSVGITGVTIEIIGATYYKDASCLHRSDAWGIVEVASVHCGLFKALLDKQYCADKVKAKILELSHDGYVPVVEDLGNNACPVTRSTPPPRPCTMTCTGASA
jgi:hypothetical protein